MNPILRILLLVFIGMALLIGGCVWIVKQEVAACCAGCNSLKSDWIPPASHSAWKSRKNYIKASQKLIAEKRFENFQKFNPHVEKVLKKRAES